MSITKQSAVTKLYNLIAIAALRGNQIEPGQFARTGYDGVLPKVCLCGSVLAATGISVEELENRDGDGVIRAVAKKLGITLKQAASLNNGFEDISKNEVHVVGTNWYGKEDKSPLSKGVDKEWFKIGKNLRKEYNATEA